jgi:hypothetical protein
MLSRRQHGSRFLVSPFLPSTRIRRDLTVALRARAGRRRSPAPERFRGPRTSHDHFSTGVPMGCPINAVTKTGWEGTGVAPASAVRGRTWTSHERTLQGCQPASFAIFLTNTACARRCGWHAL